MGCCRRSRAASTSCDGLSPKQVRERAVSCRLKESNWSQPVPCMSRETAPVLGRQTARNLVLRRLAPQWQPHRETIDALQPGHHKLNVRYCIRIELTTGTRKRSAQFLPILGGLCFASVLRTIRNLSLRFPWPVRDVSRLGACHG